LWYRISEYAVDICFFIDMVLTFFTAIPDPERTSSTITDKKVIAISYLKSWFVIDLISIIPFAEILTSSTGSLVGFAKFA
jgi:potassium channel